MPIPYQPTKAIPYTPGQNFNTDIVKTTDLQTKLDTGNYGDQVGGAQLTGAKKIAGSISKGAEDISKGFDTTKPMLSRVGNTLKGFAEAGLGTITGASEIAFSPVTPAIRAVTKTITPVLRQQNPELAKLYDTLAPKLDALAQKHPDSATIIGDALNTALLAWGGPKAEVPLKNIAEDVLTKEGLSAAKKDIVAIPGQIKNAIKKPVVPETMAGKIIQGTTEDIPRATGPLSKIDISKVKTYEDLSSSLSKKVETDSAALDTKLDTNKTVTKLKDLSLQEKVGDKTISHNYIKDSIAQLKDYYGSINDNVALAKIKQLEVKATKEGLTVKEINNLAKEQGISIDAYKKSGDLASSTKAKAAENTRTGVKSTGRKIFGDKAYAEADKALSDTMRTRDLADKMTEAVNKAKQKMVDRSIPQKVATLIGKVIDTVTGGSIKGLVKGLGLKVDESATMSALDLEKSLSKNLTKFQDAMNSKTEAEMTKKLEAMIIDPATTPPEVFAGKVKPLTTKLKGKLKP